MIGLANLLLHAKWHFIWHGALYSEVHFAWELSHIGFVLKLFTVLQVIWKAKSLCIYSLWGAKSVFVRLCLCAGVPACYGFIIISQVLCYVIVAIVYILWVIERQKRTGMSWDGVMRALSVDWSRVGFKRTTCMLRQKDHPEVHHRNIKLVIHRLTSIVSTVVDLQMVSAITPWIEVSSANTWTGLLKFSTSDWLL